MEGDDPRLSPLLIQRTKEREDAYAEIRRLQDEVTRLKGVESQFATYLSTVASCIRALRKATYD